jgi:hypothetical protein
VSGGAPFALSKWYLDGVTEGGDAVVGYAAELTWGALAVRYASVLELCGDEARSRTSLRHYEAPRVHDADVAWSASGLGVRGAWRALAAPAVRTLLATDDGRVDWTCLQPAAAATIALGDQTRQGLGYVEHVGITIPPWRLPIDALHWGRFVSPLDDEGRGDAVVWIDWQEKSGAHAARLAFHNGAAVELVRAGETEVVLGDGAVLRLDRGRVLRAGALGSTVLAAIPRLVKKLPGRMLGVEERKWVSRGVLARAGGGGSEGWAIHEVVTWP